MILNKIFENENIKMKNKIIKHQNPSKIIIFDPLSWKGGSHISLEKNLTQTVISAINQNMSCFQFFLGNPQSYTRKRCEIQDIIQARDIATNFNIMVISHACYLFNLNGSSKQLCWERYTKVDNLTKKIISELEYELSVLSNFKENAVVIHPGSYKDRKKGMDTIIKTINKINFPKNSLLLLENCAGEGNKIPRTFEEMKYILDGVENKNHIGFCIDTAHIHGQGDYNLSKPEEVSKMFKDFESIIGLEKLKLIHLNDSKVELGDKKDRHEVLGYGKIWSDENIKSCINLVKFCKEKNIPTCVETPLPIMNILEKFNNILN